MMETKHFMVKNNVIMAHLQYFYPVLKKAVGLLKLNKPVYWTIIKRTEMRYRRDIRFLNATDVSIRPLLEQLSFIKDKNKWSYVFRFGHLEIAKADFELIASKILGYIPTDVDKQM